MPNFITHYYFSNLVYDAMPENLKAIVDKSREAYKLGAIGPDLLFVLRELKDCLYANTMQYKYVRKTFEACGSFLRENKDDVKLSYMLGLINHYAIDREVHAFVNYNVEEFLPKEIHYTYQSVSHALTESAMDEDVLKNKMHEDTIKYKAHRIFKAKRRIKLSIGELYEKAVNRVYGYEFKKRTIATCFTLSELFAYVMKPSKSIKIKIFKYLDKKSNKKMMESMVRPPYQYEKIDYMNNAKKKWRIVRNEEALTDKSFYEQLHECITKCLEYMQDFIDFVFKGSPLKLDYSVNYEGIRVTE